MASKESDAEPAGYRIGELSRRVGVAPETLRAWERRYALISPTRTHGGSRVYSAEDEMRVRTMTRLRSEGVTAAEAARLAREDPQLSEQAGNGAVVAGNAAPPQADAVLAGRVSPQGAGVGATEPTPSTHPAVERSRERLLAALRLFDESAANLEFDDAVSNFELEEILEHIVLRSLWTLGEEWVGGTTTVAQEHFASNLLRGRLLGLSRGWGSGKGPQAVLACPPGEAHDLALIVFGLALRGQDWRIAFLGVDTPLFTVAEAAQTLEPKAVVLASIDGRRLRAVAAEIFDLAADHNVFLAGAGANRRLASRVGAQVLEGEATYSARWLAAQA
ncbi:hypothetical protein BH10ACT11_BH10ACT11_14620 [soil metagenome]